MIIGIDCDDVLADFLEAIIAFHNDTYNTDLKREDFFTYDFPDVWGGTMDEAFDKVREFYKTKYFDEIKPIQDSIQAIEFLKKDHELFVITSRFKSGEEKTFIWLKKHFKDAFKDVHFTHYDKNLSKAEVCKKIGATLMIDDAVKHVLDCSQAGITVIMFDMPWNQRHVFTSDVHRVYNWKEALQKIEEIDKK